MEVIKTKKVKIRKNHNCWGCTKKLERGSEVDITVTAESGRISTAYWCNVCAEIAQEVDDGEGFFYGELQEEAEFRKR